MKRFECFVLSSSQPDVSSVSTSPLVLKPSTQRNVRRLHNTIPCSVLWPICFLSRQERQQQFLYPTQTEERWVGFVGETTLQYQSCDLEMLGLDVVT